jgi:hypothetical protein
MKAAAPAAQALCAVERCSGSAELALSVAANAAVELVASVHVAPQAFADPAAAAAAASVASQTEVAAFQPDLPLMAPKALPHRQRFFLQAAWA